MEDDGGSAYQVIFEELVQPLAVKLERCKLCSLRKDISNLKARLGRLMASFSMLTLYQCQNWLILSKASKNGTTSRLLYQTKKS